jgi:hypothetical protein
VGAQARTWRSSVPNGGAAGEDGGGRGRRRGRGGFRVLELVLNGCESGLRHGAEGIVVAWSVGISDMWGGRVGL